MNPELIQRINELARKSKEGELTLEEQVEQKALRESYLEQFRERFRRQLENIEIQEESRSDR